MKKPGVDAAPPKYGATKSTKASSLSSAPSVHWRSSQSRRSRKRGRHKTDRKDAAMRAPRATDAVARRERQSVLRGDNDFELRAQAKATPTHGPVVNMLSEEEDAMNLLPTSSEQLHRMTDTCDSHASRKHTKSKKTRSKCDAKSSTSKCYPFDLNALCFYSKAVFGLGPRASHLRQQCSERRVVSVLTHLINQSAVISILI